MAKQFNWKIKCLLTWLACIILIPARVDVTYFIGLFLILFISLFLMNQLDETKPLSFSDQPKIILLILGLLLILPFVFSTFTQLGLKI